jgi:hypothetical protein
MRVRDQRRREGQEGDTRLTISLGIVAFVDESGDDMSIFDATRR